MKENWLIKQIVAVAIVYIYFKICKFYMYIYISEYI